MKIVGIVSEYNPFHNGHARQLYLIRQKLGEEAVIVCAMSGNYVQRGAPAIFDKTLRARAAVECGADLVLELPVQTALSSAEGFAAGSVSLLGRLCDTLCFGCESADAEKMTQTARLLLSPDFSLHLRTHLDTGLSFPAARQKALEQMGGESSLLSSPNNILGVEYCKAILSQNLSMEILPVQRDGGYHDLLPKPEQPSATSLRRLIREGQDISPYVPQPAAALFRDAPIHSLSAGERAVLMRLRTMTDTEFEALPYGSEGLWRKLMHASRVCATLEEILTTVKSKRYTRSRLDRMVMCAFLGLTAQQMHTPVDYARVLAFSSRGRQLLAAHRESGFFLHTGQKTHHPHWDLERRCDSLYGLFREDTPAPPDAAEKNRIFYKQK